jgi:hypothetical protein
MMGERFAARREAPGSRSIASAGGAIVVAALAGYSILYLLSDRAVPADFHVYLGAARDIRAGESPYDWFVYPPLAGIAAVPLAFLSMSSAGLVAKGLLLVCAGAILAVLGVRDWRCYAVAMLWPSVHTGVQTGNIALLLVLGVALLWRWRARPPLAGLALGVSVAAKFLMWPLVIWLAAVGRRAAAVWSVALGAAIFIASWLVVGLGELAGYPSRLRYLDRETGGDGYTIDALVRDVGAGTVVARGLMLAVAVAVVVGVIIAGRRGEELRSFVLGIAATLALSPIVWVIYFSVLLVPVAIVRPRLSPLWFLPVAMWPFTHGGGNGSTLGTAVIMTLAVATLAVAYRAAPSASRDPGRIAALRPVSGVVPP